MLTTTLDGLWALQVLTGIEVLSPELGLRPHMPSAETKQMALTHPVTAELVAEGVIDEAGTVDPVVVEWLTVISRRDIALVMHVQTPANTTERTTVVLCRFAQWWAILERAGELVRLSGAGVSTAESAANSVIKAQLARLCGTNKPAPLRPVTLDVDTLVARVTSEERLRQFLIGQRLDAEQMQIVLMAADPRRSAQASIVAVQAGVESGLPTRAHVERSVVTIIDSPEGRLVAEHMPRGGKTWMIISPGTESNIAAAVNHMLRRLPADEEWFSYRKVV